MATLQTVSESIDNNTNVLPQQPISNISLNPTTIKQAANGKITTKELNVGAISTDCVEYSLTDATIKIEVDTGDTTSTEKDIDDVIKTEEDTKNKEVVKESSSNIVLQTFSGARSKGRLLGILRKNASAPTLSTRTSLSEFDNLAYEGDDVDTTNLSFADIVNTLTRPPIKEDVHPYGRGHLYRTAFDGESPKIHQDEGKLFVWIIAALALLGIAGAVILMSFVYEPIGYSAETSTVTTFLNTTNDTELLK